MFIGDMTDHHGFQVTNDFRITLSIIVDGKFDKNQVRIVRDHIASQAEYSQVAACPGDTRVKGLDQRIRILCPQAPDNAIEPSGPRHGDRAANGRKGRWLPLFQPMEERNQIATGSGEVVSPTVFQSRIANRGFTHPCRNKRKASHHQCECPHGPYRCHC